MTDGRDQHRRKVAAPTAVQRAILEGSKPMAPEVDGVPLIPVDDRSAPVEMSVLQRIEYRQQQQDLGQLEIARAVGDIKTSTAKTAGALEVLTAILGKQEAREARKEAADLALTEKREERADKRDERKTTSREKILVALFAAVAAVAGYMYARAPASSAAAPHFAQPTAPIGAP